MSSAQPLVAGFMKHGVAVDQSAMGALMASAPDLQKVKDFALAAVDKAAGLADAAGAELREMIGGLKGKESGGESKNGGETLADGTVWIQSQEELLRFKAGLKGSSAPAPVEPIEVGSAKL
jgi:insulysin